MKKQETQAAKGPCSQVSSAYAFVPFVAFSKNDLGGLTEFVQAKLDCALRICVIRGYAFVRRLFISPNRSFSAAQ